MKPSLLASVLALTVAVAPGCGGSEEPELPPSVILISLDTLRRDHMSLYGYERETTPFLEEFASECVVYDRAMAVCSWTLITHVSMLTGMNPLGHGVVTADKALSPKIPMLAERFQARGYQTLGYHFPTWVHPRHGFARGFDEFLAHEDAEQANEHMLAGLDGLNPNRPLFLFVHLFDLHSQRLRDPGTTFYYPPPPYDELYSADAAERIASQPVGRMAFGEGLLPEEYRQSLHDLYDGGVNYIDDLMRRWVDEWRERGLLDNAIVIITADHGESLGTRDGHIRGHGWPFQEGLRLPLMIRYPDLHRAGERDDRLASQPDIVPTVLDVLGWEREPWLQGYSLLEGRPEDTVLVADNPPLAVRVQWPMKFVYGAEGGKSGWAFDLEKDPDELNPITADELGAEGLDELARRLQIASLVELDKLEKLDAPPIPASDDMEAGEVEALQNMGYTADGD